jgi:LacI family transcriptional regulator
MEPRPTLEDVARLAGVGKATVSLALRNHPKISAATRARVKAAAEQIDYRPDPALSRIAAYRWHSREHPSDATIAFVTTVHPSLQTELAPEMREAARAQGERLGYRVEHFRLEDYAGPEQLARVLYHRGIRGVIVGQIFPEDFVRRFPWEQFACVGAHVGYHQPPVNVVVPDFLHTMVRVWREAMRAGHRRIGVALLKEFQAVDLFDKVSAALFCQTQLEPASQVIPVRHFPIDDRSEFQVWLRQYRPEVVIGFNDSVYWWLLDAGCRVPDEVAFISLMLEQNAEAERSLTGMRSDLALIGRIALEQLDILLRTNQVGLPARPLIVQAPGTWCPGGTLAHSPPASRPSPNAAEVAAP